MSRNISRQRYAALAAFALIVASAPAASAAGVVQDPLPVGPDAYFIGLVNGSSSEGSIALACLSPATPGETGHPLPGQTVEVETVLAVASVTGFTGSAAHSIDAIFTTPSAAAANPPIVFTAFFVPEAIPTTDTFPCSGSGVVSFVPLPTSPTARGFAVPVAFGSVTSNG
jgi:hypothetical protein